MKSDFLPAAPWCSGEVAGVDAGALNERVNEQKLRVNRTGKPVSTGSPLTSRLHGSCRTGAASWQRMAMKQRVETDSAAFFTVVLRAHIRTFSLLLSCCVFVLL